jgi:hypothetical protein
MTYEPGSLYLHAHQKGIAIAIGAHRHQFEAVAGSFALHPKGIPCPAEESDVPGLARPLERVFIHETKHQDFVRARVLDNGRHQTLHFVEVDLRIHMRSLTAQTKSPLKLWASAGLKLDVCWTSSDRHPRQRAVRMMMMMAVMAMSQHRTIVT